MSCSRSAAFLLMTCMTSTVAHAQRCAPSFYDSVRLDLHGAQNVVAAPDFDRDGRPDLLFVDTDGVKVAMNLGGGSFGAPQTVLPAGYTALVGDMDGDGIPDLVGFRKDSASSSIEVYKGSGQSFRRVSSAAVPAAAGSPVLGDFDGNGTLDLAILVGSFDLWVFPGDGHGGLGPPRVQVILPGADNPFSLFTAHAYQLWAQDVDGDGRADLLVGVSTYKYNGLMTLISGPAGVFAQSPAGPVGGGYIRSPRVFSGDLDGDGHADTVVLSGFMPGPDWIDVYLWRPTGLLDVPGQSTGKTDSEFANFGPLADLDGDGHLDLLETRGAGPGARLVLWLGDDAGHFRRDRSFPLPFLPWGTPIVAADFDGDGRVDLVVGGAYPRFIPNACWSGYQRTVVVPVLVSTAGAAGTFWTSDLTITNSGSTPARVDLTYTASAGGGGGTVTTTLAPGVQLSDASAFDLLARLGLELPPAGSRIATLSAVFHGLSSEASGSLAVRTSSGGAGVSYPAIVPSSRMASPTVFFSPSTPTVVTGLKQDGEDRSNLGVSHTGRQGDDPLTLAITVSSTDPSAPGEVHLPPITLKPGETRQIDRVLTASGLNAASGYARIVSTGPGAPAPFASWGVVNDNTGTSDGSLVLGRDDAGGYYGNGWVIPSVTESGSYRTEVVLTALDNVSSGTVSSSVTLRYRSPDLASSSGSVSMSVAVPLQSGVRIPNVVAALRAADPAGVGPIGPTYAGILEIQPDGYPINAFARVLGEPRRYGVSIAPVERPAYPKSFPAPARSAIVPDLRQDARFRSNLVIAELYELSQPALYRVELFDAGGRQVASREVRPAGAGWLQINRILADWAPGTQRGWARVTQIEPLSTEDLTHAGFVTYAVINDGAAPGLGTGDGSIVWMETEP